MACAKCTNFTLGLYKHVTKWQRYTTFNLHID
jgi:hypothetical protein